MKASRWLIAQSSKLVGGRPVMSWTDWVTTAGALTSKAHWFMRRSSYSGGNTLPYSARASESDNTVMSIGCSMALLTRPTCSRIVNAAGPVGTTFCPSSC